MEIYLAAAATVTKVVDWIRNMFDSSGKAPKWVWNIAAFAGGLVIAFATKLNAWPDQPVLGLIATGLFIGAGASGFHELFDLLSSTAKQAVTRVRSS
jgi:hypothetical protein